MCLAKASKHELAFLARIFCDLPWEFDQKSYSEDFPGNGGLDTSGYIYVPTKCQWANCNLLLFLHGCIGAKEYVGDKVIVQAGFLEGIRTILHKNGIKVFVKIANPLFYITYELRLDINTLMSTKFHKPQPNIYLKCVCGNNVQPKFFFFSVLLFFGWKKNKLLLCITLQLLITKN